MKKHLLLMAAMLVAVCAQAQVLKASGRAAKAPVATNRTITPGANQSWWGYFSEEDASASNYDGLGTGDNENFEAAIYIPAGHAMVSNSTIKAIRVWFDSNISNMTGMKVWIAKSLSKNAESADYVQDVDVSTLVVGINDIQLDTPYEVNGNGIYVGYSIDLNTTCYPVMEGGEYVENSFFIRSSKNVTSWGAIDSFGKLALQVLVESESFPQDAAILGALDPVVVAIGQTADAKVKISNCGLNPIQSIDYTITADGVTSAEQHVNFLLPINANVTGYATITVNADATKGQKQRTLTITKVNGVANEASANSADFMVYTVETLVPHRVTIEEFTGTGCGWCPRGLVGMDKLRKEFGDLFVGIGIHQYNSSDAMYISPTKYARLNFSGAPECTLERRYYTDPYYGENNSILEDFVAIQATPALAGIEVEGMWSEDGKTVDAKAHVQPLIDNMSFNIEFVLVADGLTGTGSKWNQSNYYYQYSASQLPEDLQQFGSGGKYGTSSFSGWKFNDVAISSSYSNNTNQAAPLENLSADGVTVSEFTLNMPTSTTLLNAIHADKVYVIALLINPADGTITNAAKALVKEYNPTGIQDVTSSLRNAEELERYSIDGIRLHTPQKGLNIIRLSDGRTIKVMK